MALTGFRQNTRAALRMPFLKKLFWTYFLLLIFEGALRKWVLPQLSAPLLIIRDPIGLLIIWEAYRTHKWPKQWSAAVALLTVGILTLGFMQLVAGESSWIAAAFGLRSYLLPFPVAFIMGENLDEEDLRKFVNCTLWLMLPLTALEVAQYIAPATSWLNKGAYSGSAQLDYAAGHVRASATFSYVMGPMCYLPLAAAFIFTGLGKPGYVSKLLLWAAAASLLLSIPVTGSRTAVFELAAVVACVGVAAFFGISEFVRSLQMILILTLIAIPVSRLPVFADSVDTLVTRFTNATASEGGSTESSIFQRVIGPYLYTLQEDTLDHPWLGEGVGYGSLAVTKVVTGEISMRAGEEEFPRVIFEFGVPGGLLFMLMRYGLAIMISVKGLKRARDGDPLAWLMVPLMFRTVVFGTLEQPTMQGFMVISIAFCLAASHEAHEQPEASGSMAVLTQPQRFRLNPR